MISLGVSEQRNLGSVQVKWRTLSICTQATKTIHSDLCNLLTDRVKWWWSEIFKFLASAVIQFCIDCFCNQYPHEKIHGPNVGSMMAGDQPYPKYAGNKVYRSWQENADIKHHIFYMQLSPVLLKQYFLKINIHVIRAKESFFCGLWDVRNLNIFKNCTLYFCGYNSASLI